MIRAIAFLVLLCAFAAPAAAQHVSVRFGSRDLAVAAQVNLGGTHAPQVVVHGSPTWRIVRERVWVPGCQRVVEIPAQFGWGRDACGRPIRICIAPARREIIQEPGHWEWRERRVRIDRPGGRIIDHHGGIPVGRVGPGHRGTPRPTLRGRRFH